ncbi:hypothetical protein [Flavobacterium aquidurense]|uniref:Uncharacterized protein n=1 Tax=Flavobacterium aquidurense TaxID=362413 RepID=A0A0Q0RXM7_9FLAO|nr:hypothetical protein [Flavobacterium aquidurense]KQB37094.1 hypothetical protein RC62_2260 [Flavobacterium aquidurense]
METYTDYTYEEAEIYFHQKYQRGHLDIDTALLINNAIDTLLKKDNIARNENIPNEEQVVNEDDYITNNPDEEFEIIDVDNDEEEHIEDEDHFDDDDLERNDN